MAHFPHHEPSRWEFGRCESDEHRIRRLTLQRMHEDIDRYRQPTQPTWWEDQRYIDQVVPSQFTSPDSFDNFNYGYQVYARQAARCPIRNLSEATDESDPIRYNVKRVAIDKTWNNRRCCLGRSAQLCSGSSSKRIELPPLNRCHRVNVNDEGVKTCQQQRQTCRAFQNPTTTSAAADTGTGNQCPVRCMSSCSSMTSGRSGPGLNNCGDVCNNNNIDNDNSNNNNNNCQASDEYDYNKDGVDYVIPDVFYDNNNDLDLQVRGVGFQHPPRPWNWNTPRRPMKIALDAYPLPGHQNTSCGGEVEGGPSEFLCRPAKRWPQFPVNRSLPGVRLNPNLEDDQKRVICHRVFRCESENTPENEYLDTVDPLVVCRLESKSATKEHRPGYGTYKIIGSKQYREKPETDIPNTMTLPAHLHKYREYLRRCPDPRKGRYDKSDPRFELILPSNKCSTILPANPNPFEYSRNPCRQQYPCGKTDPPCIMPAAVQQTSSVCFDEWNEENHWQFPTFIIQ